MLAGLDVAGLTGIEVGPLNRPLVSRGDGSILYVDHADTASLRRKYAADPNVKIDEIADVDAVWGDNTLLDAVGRTVDYVVASHVIEHVPDLISWLAEVRDVLVPGGQLRLAVPDRRFTFDYYRSETRLSDVVHAWLLKARRPLSHSILDFCLEVVEVDPIAAWQGEIPAPKPMYDLQASLSLAADARDNGAYHDVHCWVFTPISFAQLMGRLAALGLADFSCRGFFETKPNTLEFIVHAQRCNDAAMAAASWNTVSERLQAETQGDREHEDAQPSRTLALLREREAELAALRMTVKTLRAEIGVTHNS